jgi:hypothetical protein
LSRNRLWHKNVGNDYQYWANQGKPNIMVVINDPPLY